MVDDGCHTTHQLILGIVGHEIFCLAKFKGGILVLAERLHLIIEKIGNVIGIAGIQVVMQLDETLQVALAFYSLYCYL